MTHSTRRFAFVEYEDRRDADDAYHEMHNKRIGRDDVLKIEVYRLRAWTRYRIRANISPSGPVHLPPLLGGLTPVVIAIDVTGPAAADPRVVAALPPLGVVLATTLLGRTIAANVTEIGIMTVTAATPGTALAAQTLGTRYLPISQLDFLGSS